MGKNDKITNPDYKSKSCAWAPAHITGFFSTDIKDTPMESGSIGAGFNLKDGVKSYVAVERSQSREIKGGTEVSTSAIKKAMLLSDFNYEVDIKLKSNLPEGAGLGLSGAEALSSILAFSDAIGLPLTVYEIGMIAHETEVEMRTGLGDVAAQAMGGIVIRKEGGPPGEGVADKLPMQGDMKIHLLNLGQIQTSNILESQDVLHRIDRLGCEKMSEFEREPTFDRFFEISLSFAKEIGIIPPKVIEKVEYINEKNCKASIAMLGSTIFSIGSNKAKDLLEEFGEVITTKISDEGPKVIKEN